MENFFTDYTHATGPGIYELQSGSYLTGADLFCPLAGSDFDAAVGVAPSIQAGCNGIDLHTGSFSFINAAEFENFARLIVQNATGFAFKLAMESLSPQIAEVLEQLQSIANRINQFSINSCETAQAAVGSLWPGPRPPAERFVSPSATAVAASPTTRSPSTTAPGAANSRA